MPTMGFVSASPAAEPYSVAAPPGVTDPFAAATHHPCPPGTRATPTADEAKGFPLAAAWAIGALSRADAASIPVTTAASLRMSVRSEPGPESPIGRAGGFAWSVGTKSAVGPVLGG